MNNLKRYCLVVLTGLPLLACQPSAPANQAASASLSGQSAVHPDPIANKANQAGGVPNFVALVKRVKNSVVNISAEIDPRQPESPQLDPNDPWSQLYRHFMPPQVQKSRAFGSGFIISSDGYILTNAHLVNSSSRIVVTAANKQQYPARLVGLDPQTDIALLKIEGKDLAAVKIGNPDSLEVGEWVIAIGAPFGLDSTVTAGIVSAKGRNLPSETYVPYIQTDAAINPGNSGGPLFNMSGEVVGINSQIYSRSGGYMGISFSIPIDIAQKIADQLKLNGKVYHGQLGVEIQGLTPELAKSFGLPDSNGALVANVLDGSAAAKAGLQAGDVIVEADGKRIVNAADLPIIIGGHRPRDTVSLKVVRNGASRQAEVVLTGNLDEELNNHQLAQNNASAAGDKRYLNVSKLGLAALNANDPRLTDQVRSKRGVVVINSSGIAALSGILPGDQILMVNNRQVNSVAELDQLLGNSHIVALLLQRGSQRMFVTIQLS